jgi:hypothetical protein
MVDEAFCSFVGFKYVAGSTKDTGYLLRKIHQSANLSVLDSGIE